MVQSADQYTNLLEQQFSRLPGFIQTALRDPFNWVDDMVRDIAGQPAELVQAGQGYAALGNRIDSIAAQQSSDRTAILGHAWAGAAYDSFSTQMAQVEQRIRTLGQAAAQTQPLLDAAARACTQSADVIVSLVEGFVSFALQDLIISGVLSLVSFGASAAAGAAAAIAKFAEVCTEIGGIIEKLAAVLERIAALLEKVAELCRKAEEFLTTLQRTLKAEKGWKNLKAWQAKGTRAAITTVARDGVSYPLDGGTFPGPVGAALGATTHGYQAVTDAQQAHG